MARTMTKVIPVKVISDEMNCYATIQRAMLSAVTAALRLGNAEKAEEFNDLRKWASAQFDIKVTQKKREDKSNPALG